MLIAGIDEAGYGPVLGPLVVTGTAFRVPDVAPPAPTLTTASALRDEHAAGTPPLPPDVAATPSTHASRDATDIDGSKPQTSAQPDGEAGSAPAFCPPPDLWELLAASICRSSGRGELRLPIADSKKLYNRSGGLIHLERTALVMLQTAERTPKTFRGLLQTLDPASLPDLNEYPWHRDYDCALPRTTTVADIATRANAVRRDMRAQGVELCGVYSSVLCEGHFNRLVAQTHNKATVLMRLALRIAQRIIQRSSGDVRIVIDRQGGREHYVDKLLTFFQGAELTVDEETPERSAYLLNYGRRRFAIEFRTQGETHHLPVALASIYSKYLRELMMQGLNAFFSTFMPELKPTAGYYTDAQRYLADIEPLILRERIDRAMLIRSR